MIKVNAYTTGYNTPSARYRVRQLIPFLNELNIVTNEIYSKSGTFPPKDFLKRILWGVENLTENGLKVMKQPSSDVTWLQKPLLSKHYTFERFLKGPLVFDVDDAIHIPDHSFVKKITQRSDRIICGNSFLAEHFSKWNDNIDIIPTAVDVSKYENITSEIGDDVFYILWTGTSSGYPFVYSIEKALKNIVDKYSHVKIKIVSNEKPQFTLLKSEDYIFSYWSREIEFSSIVNAHVGIMPIFDNDSSRGKCSYKMLCYMAAKLPVVVTAVGMNSEVLEIGEFGYGASSLEEWYDALEDLILNNEKRKKYGVEANKICRENFDVQIIASKISSTFNSVL